jgi:hypothetical protein
MMLGCVLIASLAFGQEQQAAPAAAHSAPPAAQAEQPPEQTQVQPEVPVEQPAAAQAEQLGAEPAEASVAETAEPSVPAEPQVQQVPEEAVRAEPQIEQVPGYEEETVAQEELRMMEEGLTGEETTVAEEAVEQPDEPEQAALELEAEETVAHRQEILPQHERGKTKLGVLLLESATGHNDVAAEMTKVLIQRLDSLGIYELYYPEDIARALESSRMRVPANCRDPQCVNDIGRALGVRRMIYGAVDMTGLRYGVQLVLLNVVSGRPIETVSIEGAPGVPARDVLMTAIDRIHGYPAQGNVTRYLGPPVNNLSEFLWSTVAVQGTGIFYALINYGIGGTGSGNDVAYSGYNKNEVLSGVPGLSNQIPIFARPAALANAYTAVSDDAYGVLYNPAGMAWVTQRDAVLTYQYRFGMDMIAASYANRALRDLGFGQAIVLATDRDGAMTEMLFVTAVGYKFHQDYLFGPISVGASLKFMGNTVRALSPDSPFGQSYGAGLDLGFMWELSRDIRYGLMFRDVPAINKWKNRTTGERYTEAQPPTLHMGGSYRAGYNAFLTADGQIPLYGDQPWIMAGGIEYEFFRMLALRIGLQREILDEESNWWKITGGAGFTFGTGASWGRDMSLDVAYEYNTLHLFPVLNVSLRVGF